MGSLGVYYDRLLETGDVAVLPTFVIKNTYSNKYFLAISWHYKHLQKKWFSLVLPEEEKLPLCCLQMKYLAVFLPRSSPLDLTLTKTAGNL
jgi:hypothetical protein